MTSLIWNAEILQMVHEKTYGMHFPDASVHLLTPMNPPLSARDILSCNWLVCSLTSFFLFYNVPFCQQAYNYRWSDCNRLFYLFAHVVLHLDRFLFLLPDLFSSPYSYIWMISIIVFWTICSLFIIIIQFQHANKCFLFLFIKFFWAFMLRSTIHLPPIEEGEFLLYFVK